MTAATKPMALGVWGCRGRMGQRITALAENDPDFRLAALWEHPQHSDLGQTHGGCPITHDLSRISSCDVVIDFTLPEGTRTLLPAAVEAGVPCVIGTTGLTEEDHQQLKTASEKIPIVYSTNMSVGVNLLFRTVQQLASSLPSNYHIRIEETHHVHKKDAPSGTAKTLAEIIESASGRTVKDIQSFREGEVIGDHRVILDSEEDTLTLGHQAKTRDIFARGACVAAKYIVNQPPGLYSMRDVLGLNR